jgi:hypothetical protein
MPERYSEFDSESKQILSASERIVRMTTAVTVILNLIQNRC